MYSICEQTVHRHSEEEVSKKHMLKIELELQSLFGLLCTAVLIGRDPATAPSPHLAHIRVRYWSAKIDDISL